MISKLIFQFLAKLNKIILPSFTKKHLDLKRASKLQMLIIGYMYLIIRVKIEQVKQNFMLMELKYQDHLILLMMLVLTKYMLNTKTLKARRKMLLLTRHRLNTNNMF